MTRRCCRRCSPATDRRGTPSCRCGPPIRRSASDLAALPTLRSDAADRLVGRDQPVTWPLAFLHLLADGRGRAGRATHTDRLEAAAAQGRELASGGDKRSRLPDAVDALLRAPC
jgi:hypothetical protein